MSEQVCPKCSRNNVKGETRRIPLLKPPHPKTQGIVVATIIGLTAVIALVVYLTAPELALLVESYIPIGGGIAFVVILGIWVIMMWTLFTQRERTCHIYQCTACKHHWIQIPEDAYTAEYNQFLAVQKKVQRGLKFASFALIALMVGLMLFLSYR